MESRFDFKKVKNSCGAENCQLTKAIAGDMCTKCTEETFFGVGSQAEFNGELGIAEYKTSSLFTGSWFLWDGRHERGQYSEIMGKLGRQDHFCRGYIRDACIDQKDNKNIKYSQLSRKYVAGSTNDNESF
jgi:hypothetical protein